LTRFKFCQNFFLIKMLITNCENFFYFSFYFYIISWFLMVCLKVFFTFMRKTNNLLVWIFTILFIFDIKIFFYYKIYIVKMFKFYFYYSQTLVSKIIRYLYNYFLDSLLAVGRLCFTNLLFFITKIVGRGPWAYKFFFIFVF